MAYRVKVYGGNKTLFVCVEFQYPQKSGQKRRAVKKGTGKHGRCLQYSNRYYVLLYSVNRFQFFGYGKFGNLTDKLGDTL